MVNSKKSPKSENVESKKAVKKNGEKSAIDSGFTNHLAGVDKQSAAVPSSSFTINRNSFGHEYPDLMIDGFSPLRLCCMRHYPATCWCGTHVSFG